nr:HlyD family efflux transporter periplasmic adaptor subunit [uncultured Carboxylicivirga sp.]
MKIIFPPEVINHSVEMHFNQHNKPFKKIYISIVILLITIIIALPLISVNITTQSRGVIRTPSESSQIQSALSGQVDYMNLIDGKNVIKGDTLLLLVTDEINEQIELLKKQLNENNCFALDLLDLINNRKTAKCAKYEIELTHYLAKVNEMQINIDMHKKEFDISEQLYKEQVIARMEYLQKKNNYKTAVSQLNVYKNQMKNNWQSEKTKIELDNIQLLSSINRLYKECSQYVITAPTTGNITQVAGIQKGSFITPGQMLAVISPIDSLIAECYINPDDIGFIHTNQKVRIELDAFNYNQWGLLQGIVTSVSKDVIIINNNPVFKVRCQLPVNYLQLKTGKKGYLKKGMSLTGRFVITNRTLFQLLFDKVDDWFNPSLIDTTN